MIPLQMAVRNLVSSLRKTVLLASILSTAVFFFVLLLAFGAGIRDGILASITTLSTGHLNVSGFVRTSREDVAPLMRNADVMQKWVAEHVPGIERTVMRDRGWGNVISDTGSMISGMIGVDFSSEHALRQTLSPSPTHDLPPRLPAVLPPDEIILFASQAKGLGVSRGDMVTLRTETLGGQINTASARVGYVAKDMGILSSYTVLMSREMIHELYRTPADTAGVIQIYLDDIDRSDDAAATLRKHLIDAGHPLLPSSEEPFFVKLQNLVDETWEGQRYDVTTWKEESSYLLWVLNAFSSLLGYLSALLAVLATIGVMNTMWIAVRERTREIGTLRAIGMSRRQVAAVFLCEALLLGAVSSTAGAAMASVVSVSVNLAEIPFQVEAATAIFMKDTLSLHVEFPSVALVILVFSMWTSLSAAWPAWRASHIAPITAMQQVH